LRRKKVGLLVFQVRHSLKDAIGYTCRRRKDSGTQQEKNESGSTHF